MSRTIYDQIIEIVEYDASAEEGVIIEEIIITPEDTRQLEYLVKNGQWEVLGANKAFRKLYPEGRIQTVVAAINSRAQQLRTQLTPLGRTEHTRAAYIEMLNHIRELEDTVEGILSEYYTKKGKRQIDNRSRGDRFGFEDE